MKLLEVASTLILVTSSSAPLTQDKERLKRKRIEAGLSQPELAAKAGVNKSTVYRVEAGLCPAEAKTLRRLAEALGCEIADLMPPEPAADATKVQS